MQSKLNKILLVILTSALLFRLPALNQSLWLDEATSVLVARNFSATEIVAKFSPGDFHPPFYYLFLKGWITLFGSSEQVIRFPSLLFALGTVWLVYKLATLLFGTKTGILSALLMATAPLHIYYSQEARMYSLATFLAVAAVWYFANILKTERPSKSLWVEFVLSAVLLLYTDYLPALLLLFFVAFLVVGKAYIRRYGKEWFFSASAILILFAPWLPTLGQQLQGGLLVKIDVPLWWQVLGRTSIKQLLLVPIKFTIGRISSYNKVFYIAAVSASLFLIGLLFLRAAKIWRDTKLLWLWLLVPTVAAAILGIKLSVFQYFRLLFVLPAFYILLACAALTFQRRRARGLVVVLLLFVNVVASGIYLFNPRFHREDWKSAVSWVEEQSIGQRAISIFVSKNQRDPYFYYAKRVPAYGPEALDDDGFGTVYLFRYVQPIFDSQDRVRQKIEGKGYKKQEERDFNGIVVWRYTK